MATDVGVDRSCEEPGAKGKKRDNQHERTFPDDASHDTSPVGPASVVHDTADSARLEDQLRAREVFYRSIIEGAADVTTLVAPDGTVLYASATLSEPTSLGYKPEEFVGRNSLEIIHPDDREGVVRAIANDFAGVPTTVEARVLKKDGSWMCVEMRGKSIVGLDGKPVVVAHSRDITERNRLQQQLKKSKEFYESLIRGSADLILVTDRSGTVRFASDSIQRVFGYERDEVFGQQILSFVHEDDVARVAERLSKAGESPSVLIELRVRRKDGTWSDCEGSGGIISGPEGEPLLLINTRDITQRKRAERELVAAREAALAASRAKSEFLSSMSHEIRTPMNAILGMVELLWEDGTLNSEQRRYLDIMRSNGNALLHLINDILDLAKIESGRLSLESLGFDLEELIDKTLDTMSVRAHTKGLELTARILPTVPHNLIGDPLRLGQILINLLGNAIKFTDKGEVALTVDALGVAGGAGLADPTAVRLRFSVSDTGTGIPADKLGTIFSGFSQADASISRRFGGSGLGLTIVTRLTNLMGGTVEAESELGRGSTFRVVVALRADPQPAIRAHRSVERLDGVRILIVDDNQTNRLILREMLLGVGAEPGEGNCGEAALAELARARAAGRPYRLMLLDYRMPGMDGAEVARRVLSERQAWKPGDRDDTSDNTIILMLTSEDLNFQLAHLREIGLGTYLIKPIKRVELLETIGRLLSGVDADPTQPKPKPLSPVPAAERPLRILLAEDSPDNRLLIRAYFKDLPYQLETAENGRIAIEQFKASPHDLVLMDVQMPVIDGLTATRALRQWEHEQGLAPTPIIALTASALEEDVQRSLEAGCDAHVSKPVRKRVLLDAIRKVVARSTAETNATAAPGSTATGIGAALDARGYPDATPSK